MNQRDEQLINDVLASDSFSQEEKDIVKARFEKGQKSEALYQKLSETVPLSAEFMEVLNDLQSLYGDSCEHNRSYSGTCSSCFNLEKKVAHLHPDWFKDDPHMADLFEEDKLLN